MENKPVRVTGEIFFANDMVEFNSYTEASQKYVAQIGNLSDAAVDALKELGVHVGENDTKGKNISCKSNFPHKVVDADGNEVDPKTIGNGSKCIAARSSGASRIAQRQSRGPRSTTELSTRGAE